MRQPNENWLKAMIVLTGANAERLRELATLYEFHPPANKYYSILVEMLAEGRPTEVNLGDPRVLSYLHKHKILSIARGTPHTVAAKSLLSNHKTRRVLDILLLTEAPLADVARYLRELTGVTAEEQALKAYMHYYWNRDLLSRQEWATYFRSAGHPEEEILKDALYRGHEYALWKLDYRVEVPSTEAIRVIMHESMMRFLESRGAKNSKDTALMAKLWSDQVFQSAEVLSRNGESIGKVLDRLREISIKLDPSDLQGPDSLGSYTGSEDKKKSDAK